MGGTLANLRGHIMQKGGAVLAMTVLKSSRNNTKIKLETETLTVLNSMYDDAFKSFWKDAFGFGLAELTEPEAAQLVRTNSADIIRNHLIEAENSARRAGFSPLSFHAERPD
jgi:hypothetical protein